MSTPQTPEELIARLLDAWNRADADDFAALFSVDADYVSATGEWRQGRDAIRALLASDGPTLLVSVDGAVATRDHGDVCTAVFRWVTKTPSGPGRRGVTTCSLVKHSNDWLIERLQNTDVADGHA